MILKELSIYSYKEEKILNKYLFNDVGVNIILGEKKDEEDEANGVGKTTMIECISFLLGEEIHTYYKNNKILLSKNILITLKVNSNGIDFFLARYINSPNKGYILYDKTITYDLSYWKTYEDKEYKIKIQDEVLGKEINGISFASIREYVIRDEQNGFIKDTLGIADRNATTENKILAFLCNLPYNSETEIKSITKKITNLKDEKKILSTTIGKTISELKSEKAKYLSQIKKLEKDINSININKQYNLKATDYNKNKNELNKIQNKIFKLIHIKNQYQQNIENLKKKVEDIKALNDIKPFYEQLLGWFPNEISHNYEKVKNFYDFMVENRGNYFEGKIKNIDEELNDLNQLKVNLENSLKNDYKILKNSSLIEDINAMIADRENLNTKIAEINIQLGSHDRLKSITNEINILKKRPLAFNTKENRRIQFI
ncbi:AAA family ATPase [Bacillus cereus]